ncbi:MAG: nucleotidyltransferase domain-containing protein [Gammaproteobacteria bacterium]|nr:nucleotidyltransferase domain-containing protein [Gammaproteobacteria bacterium]
MNSTAIGDALFSKTQQRVLGLLFGKPDKSFYLNETVRWADMGRGTIRRELDRLVAAGVLTVSHEGNQHHYRANPECPVYNELLGIVRKTFGVADVIREALLPLAEQIDWAFIFGSVASGKETSSSDIDLMIIGSPGFSDVVAALYSSQQSLGREINPKIFRRAEWLQMVANKDAFVKDVLSKPRMDVMGDANELG